MALSSISPIAALTQFKQRLKLHTDCSLLTPKDFGQASWAFASELLLFAPEVIALPNSFHCRKLGIEAAPFLTTLPDSMGGLDHLNIIACPSFRSVPENVKPSAWADFRNCEALASLPDNFTPRRLTISGCSSLSKLPAMPNLKDLIISDGMLLDVSHLGLDTLILQDPFYPDDPEKTKGIAVEEYIRIYKSTPQVSTHDLFEDPILDHVDIT